MALLGQGFFKEMRLKKGYTLREVAKRSGVSHTQVKAIEDGTKMPGLDTAYSLCIGLDLSISDLLHWRSITGQ